MKLSELTKNKIYTIEADEVKAEFIVIHEGPMPTCIFRGEVGNEFDSNIVGAIIVQLIGWAPFIEDTFGVDGPTLFKTNEQPKQAFLFGMTFLAGRTIAVCMGCDPEIKQVFPEP